MPRRPELRVFVVANFPEFEAERIILRGIVETILKKFCLESYNTDFLFIDPVNDDAYPESRPPIEFYLNNLERWCNSDCQSTIIILTGEKLWNKRIQSQIPTRHFRTFLEVLETRDPLLWRVLNSKYPKQGTQECFGLNKSLCTKEEIELCFLAVQKAAGLCVKESFFTQDEMSSYLQSDLERFVNLVSTNPNLAKHTIWIQRRINEMVRWNGRNLSDLSNLFNHLNQKSELFDEAITLTRDEQTPSILACPNLQLIEQLALVRQTIDAKLAKSQTKTLSLPVQVLNFLTDFTSKSSDVYSKLDAEKALLTKVRLQMNKSDSPKPNQSISTMTWTDYLVLFADQTVQLLKNLIATSFLADLPNKLVLQSNNVQEKETHWKLLMNSFVGLNVQPQSYEMISSLDGMKKPEWQEASSLESRERETSVLSAYLTGSAKLPGLLYGPPGSGKSSLLRWAIRKFESVHSPPQPSPNNEPADKAIPHHPLSIVCCAARTCASFKLQSILVRFIEELATKFDCLTDATRSLCEYAEAVRCFWDLLRKANAQNPVLIVLDNIELIYPSEHVQMFRWLPHELPNRHIRILLTTNSTRIVDGFTKRFGFDCSLTIASCFQINALLNRIYPKLVMDKMKMLTKKLDFGGLPDLISLKKQIDDLVNGAVQKNTTPTYVDLLTDIAAIRQLGRGGQLGPNIPSDLPGLFVMRLQQIQFDLQQKSLLSLALFRITAYLACARIGLTLLELIELLQCDNEVITERKRRTQNESSARFPVGCLLNLLYSPNYGLASYLTLIWTDNRCVIAYASESLRQGACLFWGLQVDEGETRTGIDDYLDYKEITANTDKEAESLGPAPPKAREFHQLLIDYWLGTQGQMDKTLSTDNSNVGQSASSLSFYSTDYLRSYYWQADLPVQSNEQATSRHSNPLMGTTNKVWICNARRLTELPYQLMRTGSEHIQDLVKYVIFSHDFIFGKLLLASRPNDIISEFYYLRQVNQIRSMDALTYLIALLRSLSKKLCECPTLLSEQLAGRIGHLIGTVHADFGESLLFSIDCRAPKVNCLLPLLPFCYSPPLQPELNHVEFASPNMDTLATLSPDLRFLFTLTPTGWDDNTSKKLVDDTFIILWEVNSLTKANTFSIGKWPDHNFDAAYFPPQQNQFVLLHYTTKKTIRKRKSGYLLINMELCSIEDDLFMFWPWESELISLTRTHLMICKRQVNQSSANEDSQSLEEATAYRIPNLTSPTNKTTNIPLPCYIASNERYWIGPSYWPVPTKSSKDRKNKQQQQQQQKRQSYEDDLAAANLLQVRLSSTLDSVSAMLRCPLAANVFLSSNHGDALYVGCRSIGFICRFDLNQMNRKEVKTLKPTLELNLEKGLQELMRKEQSKLSQDNAQNLLGWDSDSLRMIEQARHQVRVQKLIISPDERYLAAVYNANDYRLLLGFWQLGTKTLIAGTMAYPESQVRFGFGANESRILHFVRGSRSQTNIEVIEISGTASGLATSSSNNPFLSANPGQRNLGKSSTGTVIKMLRFKGISQIIDECHFVRGGNIILAGGGQIVLTTVNALNMNSKGQGPLALQAIGTQLGWVNYHPELDIIYADHTSEQALFSYYNLITQNLIGHRKGGAPKLVEQNEHYLLGQPIVEDYPKERYVSMDGKWLALRYNVRKHYSTKESRSTQESPVEQDYRKPKLPYLNYYTSKWEKYLNNETIQLGGVGLAHDQSIIRLYSLSEEPGRSGLRCQISLIGETVFQLTTKYGLYTLKPDHASITKIEKLNNSKLSTMPDKSESLDQAIRPQAILSRYSSKTGEFMGYTYLEHPVVNGSQIVGNEKYLLVCCGLQGRWLRILEAPNFNTTIRDLDLHKLLKQHDDYARTANIMNIFACQAIPTTVIVHYMWPKPDLALYAATIDLATRTDNECLVNQMVCFDPLIDISPDGLIGIDANLRLVNLRKGELVALLKSTDLIPGSSVEPEILCGRITPDKAFILTVVCLSPDTDPWLIVIQNNPSHGFPVFGRALLTPIERPSAQLKQFPHIAIQLGHRGRLIVVRLDDYEEFKVFTINEPMDKIAPAAYVSAKDRIRNLLPMDKSLGEPNLWAAVQRGAKRLDDVFTQFVKSISTGSSSTESDSDD